MLPLSALSRRAFVAAAAVLAAAPNAAVGKKKKPLAFVVATVRSARLSADATRFEVAIPIEFVHPDSGFNGVRSWGCLSTWRRPLKRRAPRSSSRCSAPCP